MNDNKDRLFIKKIEISNCGRFFGDGHIINLSDSPDKNITVIIGLSGRGKSTIHDLIYWCFYGMFKNTDQNKNRDKDYGLINIDALRMLSLHGTVTAKVDISLHDDSGEKCRITRELKATKSSETSIKTRFETLNNSLVPGNLDFEEEVKLIRRNDSGDLEIIESKFIENEIKRFLPQHLSDFFLFDGENLIKFKGQESSKFIKDGITKISGLEILNSLVETSQATVNNIEKDIGKKSVTSSNLLKIKEEIDNKISDAENEISKKKEMRERKHEELSEIVKNLQQNKNANEIMKKLEGVRNDLKITKKERNKNDYNLKNFLFDKLPQSMMRKTLQEAELIFSKLEEEDKIPPSISSSAIEKILKSNPLRCVCGREFEKNDEPAGPWVTLSNIQKGIIHDQLSQGISLGRNLMSQIIDNTSSGKLESQFQEFMDERRSKRKQVERHVMDIKNYEENLENIKYTRDQEDYPKLRKEYQEEVHRLTIYIGALEEKLNKFNDELMTNNEDRERERIKEGKYDKEQKKIKLAEAVIKFTKNLEKRIEETMRQNARDATEDYFLESAPSGDNFKHLEISKNYDLSVLDSNNLKPLLSKGQAQVLGLSYVAGIRKITSTKPFLIIDSPLHNISGDARNSISEVYSKYLPGVQIVLLVTDTEYLQGDKDGAEPVGKILKKNNSVWKEYELANKTITINGNNIETREIVERNN